MHIPDGYLSPATCGAFYAVMLPLWYRATKRVKKIVKSQYVPLIAVGAAFSFLVMMFNIPVPDGTTAHAVGAVMIAIVLGTVGRRDRGQHRPRDPSVVLRRRRRARAGCELLQHGVRHAVRGVRRLPAAHAEHVAHVVAPRRHGRRGRLRRDRRGGALRGDRVRTAARAVPHGERHPALRAVPSLPDDPGHAARASHGGRRRGVHLLLRRGHLPPASERPDPAHQPPGRAGHRRRDAEEEAAQLEACVPLLRGHGRPDTDRAPRARRRVR